MKKQSMNPTARRSLLGGLGVAALAGVALGSTQAVGIVGFVAGIFAGLFGLGGGVFKTPTLVRLFQMPARTATATALFTMVFTGIAASVSHWLHGRLDWQLALPLAAAFLAGALIGNQFAGNIRSRTIEMILGTVLAIAAVAVAVHAVLN